MLISKDCFADNELRSEIKNTPDLVEGECAITGEHDFLIDIDVYNEFFLSVINLYECSTNGSALCSAIQNDWNVFRDHVTAFNILEYVTRKNKIYPRIGATTKVSYKPAVRDAVDNWNSVKKRIKEESRFFITNTDFLDICLPPTTSLDKGRILYRSRIIPFGQDNLPEDKMGCPPRKGEDGPARSGRANPLGIPFLYLAEDIDTTLYEVKPIYLDCVCVGTFEIQKNIKIIEFTSNDDFSLYSSFINGDTQFEEAVKRQLLMNAISKDLSTPMTRYDSELEYIPTQYLCEYCRHTKGAEGISYGSSLHKGGISYALFNGESAKCIKVNKYIIKSVEITKEKV